MTRFRLFDLNTEQYEAATHEAGPLLILAGAGTGKTRTLTARIAWLVNRGDEPGAILAVTFTNKAAREMKERIAGMVDPAQAKAITACTFHALCVRILRADADRLGYKNSFSIFDEGDQSGLIKKIINRTAAKDEKLDPNLAKSLISKAKNSAWRAAEDSLIGEVFRRYDEELFAQNAMDFDDLLVNAVKLLDAHPDVRAKWQSRCRQLLVDEFQDTNSLQMDLVGLLASGSPPDICVVGDDDQSIYGWRGAEVSNILEFEKYFPDPRVIRLEQNYRSTNAILGAANRLIRNNPRRRGKNLWSPESGGDPVRVVAMPDDRKEAEFVVSEIATEQPRSGRWEDFAVIYRMNAQSRVFEEELRRKKIPYRVVGGKSFFDRREVKDVLAYATVFLNASDDAALLRVIGNPPRGIGTATITLALEASAKAREPMFATLTSASFHAMCSKRAVAAIQAFADEIAAARIRVQTPGVNPAEVLSGFLTDCGYLEDLRRSCKTPDEAANREENVQELLRTLAGRGAGGLQAFLDEMTLDREREEEKSDRPGVTLITAHAAKGLEFGCVFLVGAEDGLIPHERSKSEGTIDEERRLFYVGITRAMKSLTISWCRSRMKFGSAMHCLPSPFLKEIAGDDVIEESYDEIMSRPMDEEDIAAQFARMRAMLSGS